jgi:hypothetical protein
MPALEVMSQGFVFSEYLSERVIRSGGILLLEGADGRAIWRVGANGVDVVDDGVADAVGVYFRTCKKENDRDKGGSAEWTS